MDESIITTMNVDDELKRLMTFCIRMKTKYDLEKPMRKADVWRLIQLLRPNMKDNVIRNAKMNHSKLNKDKVEYNILEIIPKLFIAALHIDDNVDPQQLEWEKTTNSKTGMIKQRHLDTYVCDYIEDMEILQKENEELREGNNYMKISGPNGHDEIVQDLKDAHRSEVNELKREIASLRSRLTLKETKAELEADRLAKQCKYYKGQLDILAYSPAQ